MADLLKLADRVEALSGPDRGADAAIARSFSHDVESDDGDFWFGPYDALPVRVPDFTGSLDAAMTLVPEGWGFRVESEGDGSRPCSASIYKPADCCNEFVISCDYAITPALALCAAALRARAANG